MDEKDFPRFFLFWAAEIGFLLGLVLTHFFVAYFYPITGCWCVLGVHFHHLYLGIIGVLLILPLYIHQTHIVGLKSYKLRLILGFLCAFFAGMMFDDILDHFILLSDPFEWLCGIYC